MTSMTVPFKRCDTVEDVWTCQSRESTGVINNNNENCNPLRPPSLKELSTDFTHKINFTECIMSFVALEPL